MALKTKKQVLEQILGSWKADKADMAILKGKRITFCEFISENPRLWVDFALLCRELRRRPQIKAHIWSWGLTLESPVANDIHAQEHHTDLTFAEVEWCEREERDGIHEVAWSFC